MPVFLAKWITFRFYNPCRITQRRREPHSPLSSMSPCTPARTTKKTTKSLRSSAFIHWLIVLAMVGVWLSSIVSKQHPKRSLKMHHKPPGTIKKALRRNHNTINRGEPATRSFSPDFRHLFRGIAQRDTALHGHRHNTATFVIQRHSNKWYTPVHNTNTNTKIPSWRSPTRPVPPRTHPRT